MHAPHSSVLPELQKLYECAAFDVDFASILESADVRDDAALAEVIEADGRLRIARGKIVELERYLNAIPELAARPDPLDAAIDVTLRSVAGGARAVPQAIESLIHQHPTLERPIREAAALNNAIWSTTGLQARITLPPPKPLPAEFGPLLPSGESRYVLQKLLGQGAFGQVYLALDRQLSEDGYTALVAIKVLIAGDRSPWARQRMIDEATKVRRVSHGNVVLVLDRGVSEHDEDFIVYEFVDGGDLSTHISEHQKLSPRQAAALVAKIACGVHAAHAAGVIHCDLKPGNIMLTAAGEPKVADFGIAVRLGDREKKHRLVHGQPDDSSMKPIGNLAFVSPEQYRGEEDAFSIPSDVYALGGILFLLLTGVLPNGSTPQDIAATHDADNGRATAPSLRELRREIDRDLESICRRAMAVRSQDRYSSAAALAEDLERWLRSEPIAWTKPRIAHVVNLWARRKPALAASVCLIALLTVSGAGVALHFWTLANRKAIEAAVQTVKLEHEQREKAGRVAIGQLMTSSLTTLKSPEHRLATEILTIIWPLEYAFGPTVLGTPDIQVQLWKNRISAIRALVEMSSADGRENTLETMLWESALAFWLVCDKDYLEAEPLLQRNYQKWQRVLHADDDWLIHLRAMASCARVNRYHVIHAITPVNDVQLHELDNELQLAANTVAQRHKGTPIHFMILQSRIDLHGSTLMNEPEISAQLTSELQALKDATSRKSAKSATQTHPAP